MHSSLYRSLPLFGLLLGCVGGCVAEPHDGAEASEAAIVGHVDAWCQGDENFDARCAPATRDGVWVRNILEVDARLQAVFEKNTGQKLCFGEAIFLDRFGKRDIGYAVWLQGKLFRGCFTTKTFRRSDVILVRQGSSALYLVETEEVVGWFTFRLTELCSDDLFRCEADVENGKLKINRLTR